RDQDRAVQRAASRLVAMQRQPRPAEEQRQHVEPGIDVAEQDRAELGLAQAPHPQPPLDLARGEALAAHVEPAGGDAQGKQDDQRHDERRKEEDRASEREPETHQPPRFRSVSSAPMVPPPLTRAPSRSTTSPLCSSRATQPNRTCGRAESTATLARSLPWLVIRAL